MFTVEQRMRSASACSGSRRRTIASSPEPPWARSLSTRVIASPTSTSLSPSPTTSRSPTSSMSGRQRSSMSSARCSSSTSSAVRPSTACSCCRTRFSSTFRSRRRLGFVPRGHGSAFCSARRPRASPRVRARREPFHSHAGGRRGHLRVGRHLCAPRTLVHRARPCLAGRALSRRRARPRPLARVSASRAGGRSGARLRRASIRHSRRFRRNPPRLGRAGCAARRPLDVRPCLAARGSGCRSGARGGRGRAPLRMVNY